MKRVIAVDFDGTLCANMWPKIGDPNRELIAQLIEEQKNGTVIILWTCRSRRMLREAVKWAKEQGLIFDYVNKNEPERIKVYNNDSRKISADVYVDDRAAAFSYGKRLNLGGKNDGKGDQEPGV